ncbi:MAG: PAS domain S-box protein [Nitrospiraceae bacterium]|nr:MAG: PAS domain S-box protein [Nitrospiraceae bacterium]
MSHRAGRKPASGPRISPAPAEGKRARRTARSDHKYHGLFEFAGDSIFIIDAEDGRFLDCNRNAAEKLGYTKQELLRRSFSAITRPGEQDAISALIPSLNAEEGFTFETCHIRSDGTTMPVEINSRIIEFDGRKAVLALARDITRRRQAELALESKNLKLLALMDSLAHTGIGVDIVGADYRIIYMNRPLEKKFGKATGRICYETYASRTAPCRPCPIADPDRAGNINTFQFSGSRGRHYEVLSAPVLNSDGRIDKVLNVIHDITERKRAEGELSRHREQLSRLVDDRTSELTSAIELLKDEIMERRRTEEALGQSEKRYRELVNYMSSGVAVFEAVDSGRDFIIKEINQAAEKIEQMRREALTGKRVTEVFPGIREFGLLDVLHHVWKTGEPRHHPLSLYRDNRISAWRDNYVYKLPSGEIVAVYDDVTEQVRSAERESELLRQLKTIFDNFPVGIVYLSRSMEIISANRFICTFTGIDEADLTGRLCYETVGEFAGDSGKQGRERICSFCKKDECIAMKRPTVIERPMKDRFMRVTTIPVLDGDGNIQRFMEIVEDITDRKLAEAEAIRASHLAALGELAAGVAHEINNPINGIINYTQLLMNKSEKGGREHDITSRIIREGDRIATIVRNLLSFARDRREEKHPVHVRDIMAEAVALIETQMEKDGIRLNVDIPAGLPLIMAQPQQIEQVFLNIISNSRYALNQKFRGFHEGKALEVRGRETVTAGIPYVEITFLDRGSGIPPHILGQVLNPFFSTKAAGQGTGLGLSISHGIISDHGGRMAISSTEGEFTSVKIELPAAVEPPRQ